MKKHNPPSDLRLPPSITAAAQPEPFRFVVDSLDWIQAAEGELSDKPKRFSMTAYTGGLMQVSAYGSPVVIDLAGLTAEAPLPILLNHEPACIVGHADEVEIKAATLKLTGVVSGTGAAAIEVIGNARQGFPWKASVGARPDKMEFVGEDVTTKVNGKTFKGPLYVARKSTLGEVSFVPLAADGKTSARVAAAAAYTHSNEEMIMDFDKWVQALGFVAGELTDAQTAALKAKYEAEVKAAQKQAKTETAPEPIKAAAAAGGAVQPSFDLRGLTLAAEKHAAAIAATAAKYAGKIEAGKLAGIQAKAGQAAAELKLQALNEEWATPRYEVEAIKAASAVEVELVRAERPAGPAIHASSRDNGPQVLEAALCLSAGLQSPEKHYKPETVEAAQKQHRGLGLQELLLICAAAAGWVGRMRITEGNLREVIKAAFSTSTISTMLSTAGNKLLLEGFNSLPQSWRKVASIGNVSDFKQISRFRLTTGLEYEELGPAGEIKHGTVGQESYTEQAKTYAKMLTLTRTDIINDDLGAFNALRNRLGIGAAIKMNKLFWSTWLTASNAGVFWSAAHGNLVTSSALAEAGLNTAVAAFRDMAGPDGNMMSLEPALLLVPSALEATARKLYVSQEQRDTTSSTKFPTANIYYNLFKPVIVPELGNSAYTGSSATTWFLLADPRILASAAMCFLDGQESPTIESADADFEVLGVSFRGYHDFGTAMTEYRPSVKATA